MDGRMNEWPINLSIPLERSELPDGVEYATRLVPVIPADLGRELYGALVDAIAHNCNATEGDSAGWTQEDYDAWDAARARYEREVGE